VLSGWQLLEPWPLFSSHVLGLFGPSSGSTRSWNSFSSYMRKLGHLVREDVAFPELHIAEAMQRMAQVHLDIQ